MCECMSEFFLVVLNIPLVLVALTFLFFGVMVTAFFPTLLTWLESAAENLSEYEKNMLLDFFREISGYTNICGIVLLVLGSLLLVVTILGLAGVCSKQSCVIVAYCVLVGLISVTIITAATLILVNSKVILTPLGDEVVRQLEADFNDPDNPAIAGDFSSLEPFTAGIVALLRVMPCCGVYSYRDFNASESWNHVYLYGSKNVQYAQVPVMCCREKTRYDNSDFSYYRPGSPTELNTACLSTPTNGNAFLDTSCIDYLASISQPAGLIILGIGTAVFVIFILAVYLSCKYGKKQSKVTPVKSIRI